VFLFFSANVTGILVAACILIEVKTRFVPTVPVWPMASSVGAWIAKDEMRKGGRMWLMSGTV
jgi:hypothetical protein